MFLFYAQASSFLFRFNNVLKLSVMDVIVYVVVYVYSVWCEEIANRKRQLRGTDSSVPFIREELYSGWTGNGPEGSGGVVIDAAR